MTDTATETSIEEALDEFRQWLSDNWDPDLTVRQWWERLGLAGWSAPSLPTTAYGRGLSRNDAVRVAVELHQFGALGAPGGLGLLLAAPTIATHGTQEQVDIYVRDIVTGARSWCQLFSEPSAGSDLAGLQTRALKDGDEWIVNGQKVWTSNGQKADLGMLMARTDPSVPKHQGITYFALEMIQPGVEVRPLKELTGRALFNEVFMTDARVADAAVIGGVNNGWAVANTTLANERAGLGSGGGNAAGSVAVPGTVGGDLDKRAGDFAPAARAGAKRAKGRDDDGAQSLRAMGNTPKLLADLAARTGAATDPLVRQGLAELYTWTELGRFNGLRQKATKAAGGDIPGMANIAKLSMSTIMRLTRDLGLQIAGASGMLHGYDAEGKASAAGAVSDPAVQVVTEIALWAQAPSIYGGTDQVQRNIIGERVLGLPKEPNNDRTVPFADLPKNN